MKCFLSTLKYDTVVEEMFFLVLRVLFRGVSDVKARGKKITFQTVICHNKILCTIGPSITDNFYYFLFSFPFTNCFNYNKHSVSTWNVFLYGFTL